MKKGMHNYWISLVEEIPYELYVILLTIFLFALFILIGKKGCLRGLRYSLMVLFIEYIVLLYSSTVFLRPVSKVFTYDYLPFWSYFAYLDGREPNALIENFANVLVFIPVGLMAGFIFLNISLRKVATLGACVSVGIEILQLLFKKGFSEIDDIIHNTLGCLLGYTLYLIIVKVWNCSGNYCRLR